MHDGAIARSAARPCSGGRLAASARPASTADARLAGRGERVQHRVDTRRRGGAPRRSGHRRRWRRRHTRRRRSHAAGRRRRRRRSRCGGVLVAGVFETAVGDQHDAAEIGLVAIGLGAPVAAHGAVLVDVSARCRSRRTDRSVGASAAPGMATRRTSRQHGAAALTEPVCGHDGRAALQARHLPAVHSLVLGRIAFAFSTKSMRSHMSVVSCASAR